MTWTYGTTGSQENAGRISVRAYRLCKECLEAVMNRANSKGCHSYTPWDVNADLICGNLHQWGVHKALPLNQAKVEYGDGHQKGIIHTRHLTD